MEDILNRLSIHKDRNNTKVVYRLFDIVETNSISNEENLINMENSMFNTSNINERLDICYKLFISDTTHFDFLNQNELNEINKLKNEFNETENIETKLKNIIIIFEIIGFDMFFPYQAYKLILNDKLN